MGHENYGLGAMVDCIFDCWDGTGDTLVIGDLLVRIKGDIEINLS
jgi:hypothetical protein